MTRKAPNSASDTVDDRGDDGDGLRLDKWLWQARFFKTRSLAAAIAEKKKLRINKMIVTKAHYKVRLGDVLTFAQGPRIRVVRVLALGVRRGPASEARMLYEDLIEEQPGRSVKGETASSPTDSGGAPASRPVREAWGVKGGVDPRRARRQARIAKMNGR